MKVYEIKKRVSISPKAWKGIYFLFFLNLGVAFGNVSFFSKYYLIIEFCIFILLLFILFNPRSRQVYKLVFDEKSNVLSIFYYQFVFLTFEKVIPYNFLKFNYKHKVFVRGKAPVTLDIIGVKGFVAEIKRKYNLGWSDEDVDNIHKELEKIKQNGNNS